MEAKALAAARWERLRGAEEQIIREEAALAVRPKKRPAQPTDDTLPDRTIEKQSRDFEEQTKHKQGALAELKKQVKAERRELESFISKRK